MKTLKFDTYTKVYTRSLRSILWKKIHVPQKNSDYIRKYFFLRNASSKTSIEILKSILKVPIFSTHFKYNFN